MDFARSRAVLGVGIVGASLAATAKTIAIALAGIALAAILAVVVLAIARNVLPRIRWGRFSLEFRSIRQPSDRGRP
jgi:ABC-type phosphate/phosphonate transport system permease subunit